MKKLLATFATFLFAFTVFADYTNTTTIAVPNSLLINTNDIVGIQSVTNHFASTTAGITNGILLMLNFVEQHIKWNDVVFHVLYVNFPSVEMAQTYPFKLPLFSDIPSAVPDDIDNLDSYVLSFWNNTFQQIGDKSLFYEDEAGYNLLVLSGTFTFQVSCDNENLTTRKQICEQIALKIIENIQ